MEDIGKLTPLDETLNHQIADTFATVIESDLGWTEKVWGSIAKKDGSLQVDFGLGKYHNRNVMDGFGGVSRQSQQWTVRCSRELSSNLQNPVVGPVRYEVVEPLKKVRFILDRNKTQPIAFDILFEGELPPFFEKRNRLRVGNRINQDVVRYHQYGKVSGWVEVEGTRHAVDDSWFGYRDHSWGMRGTSIGAHPTDLQPGTSGNRNLKLVWSPWCLQRPDGSRYEIHHFLINSDNWSYFSGHINSADDKGNVHHQPIVRMTPRVTLDRKTRQFQQGNYEIMLDTGEVREVSVSALGATGFYLRTAEYGGWKGGRHGSWRGEYHEDGEYIEDVVAVLPELGQLRDCPVRIRDGDAEGYGILESIYSGVFPDMGLDADSDFASDL